MRGAPFLLLLALGACDTTGVGVLGAVTLGSVATIGRTPVDAVVSVVSGRDCSAVRLDRGESYCKPEEPPLAPAPYCTRSIGAVDCWNSPPLALPYPRGVADRPALTPAQETHRTQRWPGLW